jgi:hypothetical protein
MRLTREKELARECIVERTRKASSSEDERGGRRMHLPDRLGGRLEKRGCS